MKRFRVFALVSAALGLMAVAAASPAETLTGLLGACRASMSRPGMGGLRTGPGQRVGQAVADGYSVS
jgi:hypothetical protein